MTTLTNNLGEVVGSFSYDAWGNGLSSSGGRAVDNPYRYQTKEVLAGMSLL